LKNLVIGARGMLGIDLCRILQTPGSVVEGLDLPELDVRDADQVFAALADRRPERVFHLAALTDVDGCERNPDAAYYTNTLGTHNVALACQRHGIELIYVSTLAVFDGEKAEAYDEFDTPAPRSVYSRSKYQGELLVQRLVPHHYIVRAGWLFGGGHEDKKFVAKMMELSRQKSELKVVDDKFGSPTYTRDFSCGLAKLVTTGQYGTYHMVNTGAPASRLEVARHIIEYAGIDTCRLLAVSSAEFPLPAPRPRMEAGRNYQLELRGWNWMRPWQAALQEYITTTLI
jgi:dTDP-4-dehydrorhamnose reductase